MVRVGVALDRPKSLMFAMLTLMFVLMFVLTFVLMFKSIMFCLQCFLINLSQLIRVTCLIASVEAEPPDANSLEQIFQNFLFYRIC